MRPLLHCSFILKFESRNWSLHDNMVAWNASLLQASVLPPDAPPPVPLLR